MEENLFEISTKSPGKILICGGYLILKPGNSGFVVDVDIYFNCKSRVKYVKSSKLNMKNLKIKIRSLNFNTQYYYELETSYSNSQLTLNLIKDHKQPENEFIFYALLFSFYSVVVEYNSNYSLFNMIDEIEIDLEGDEYFYTFEKGNVNNKNKTGLGSSSALITSIVTNIFLIFKKSVENIHSPNKGNLNKILTRQQISNVLLFSLLANNYAQKKIGSGFDIQSCLIGSHVFQRCSIIDKFFDYFPSCINNTQIDINIVDKIKQFTLIYAQDYFSKIIEIPNLNFINILMISLYEGSNTRTLVSKVLDWAKKNQKCRKFTLYR